MVLKQYVPEEKKKRTRRSPVDADESLPSARGSTKKRKRQQGDSSVPVVIDHNRPAAPKKKKLRTVANAKSKIKKIKSEIVTEEELLGSLPTVEPGSQEQEHLDEYLHMFRKLRRLIRKAENTCLDAGNSRDYYALCTLYSAQREVIADIRSVSDMSSQVKYLEDNVMQPLTRSIGQNLLDVFYQVRKLITETSKPSETQFALSKYEELMREQAKFLQHTHGDAMDKINKFMLGGK